MTSKEAYVWIWLDGKVDPIVCGRIEKKWKTVCEEAELSQVDRNLLWKRQFLNPFSLEGVKG